MTGYWIRHRFIHTLVLCCGLALASSLMFVVPYITRVSNSYNAQSIYKNTDIDFIAPEPSFKQVNELPGTNGIYEVFPYYLTNTSVDVAGVSKTTTVLLSDHFKNIDFTMYNSKRMIKKSSEVIDNPILVDWQFCKDTGAELGDTVSITIARNHVDFRIAAIYETNSIYEGGAVLAEINNDQKKMIEEQSQNSGYSGMYISANDYDACKNYLKSDYRPLGRLKDRDQFDNEEQYRVHYDAIMSAGYANEITDLRIREDVANKSVSPLMVFLGALISVCIVIAFNVCMADRGCEKGYFKKYCVPKGQNVNGYYTTSFITESFLFILLYAVSVFVSISFASVYVPKNALDLKLAVIPAAIIIAEIVSLKMNKTKLTVIIRKYEEEKNEKGIAEKTQHVEEGITSGTM